MAFKGQLMDLLNDIQMASAEVLYRSEHITQADCQKLAADPENYELAANLLQSIADEQYGLIEEITKVRVLLGLPESPGDKS